MSEQHVELITFCAYAHAEKWLRLLKHRIDVRIRSLGASIICSACWKRLTDKNISIPFRFSSLVCYFFVAQLTKMHSFLRFGIHLSLPLSPLRMCYCPLSNKYISCYLFINMGWCFSSNKFLICCYISCTFCSYVSFLRLFSSLRQSFLDIYLYQIGTGRADTRRNILQQIKSI